MSFGGNFDDESEVMSEINMTPLVDVMLVLLIIFIITIPVINHAVKIDLPKASSQASPIKPENIQVVIDASGQLFWNGAMIELALLKNKISTAAMQSPQPELRLSADRQTPYEQVAQVMAAAQSGGLGKIGFITTPVTHP